MQHRRKLRGVLDHQVLYNDQFVALAGRPVSGWSGGLDDGRWLLREIEIFNDTLNRAVKSI